MTLRRLTVLALFLSLFFVVGCEQPAKPLVLKEIGPPKVKVGESFNVQPHGGSAMWVKVENGTQTAVIVWGDRQLITTFQNPGFLTAEVPKDLYDKPGQFQISLLDAKTGAKSNSLSLTVEP